jgi:hypothetical protein
MKAEQRYQIQLPPQEELAHLVRLTAGLLASGLTTPNAAALSDDNGAAAELPVARDIAGQLLEQLRWDVERRVDEFPERYDLARPRGPADRTDIAEIKAPLRLKPIINPC